MDPHLHLVIVNDRFLTTEVASLELRQPSEKIVIRFHSGKVLLFDFSAVTWITNPSEVDVGSLKIQRGETVFFGISRILAFRGSRVEYWHLCFQNGVERTYDLTELVVTRSCLAAPRTRNILSYLKRAADVVSLRGDDGTNLLSKQLDKLDFVGGETAFAAFMDPAEYPLGELPETEAIFPFGCNASQLLAVERALTNQISVVQGPPGTGKTQTILNIVANLLVVGKTVQVVSNNNLATTNVVEKLAASDYGLDFLVAPLGNRENKERFLKGQSGEYPDSLLSWRSDHAKTKEFLGKIGEDSRALKELFAHQEQHAFLQQDLKELELEYRHFEPRYEAARGASSHAKARKDMDSQTVLRLWYRCETYAARGRALSWWFLFSNWLWNGVAGLAAHRRDLGTAVLLLQRLFYATKRNELRHEIDRLEELLKERSMEPLLRGLAAKSMRYLRAVLHEKYRGKSERRIFDDNDLFKRPSAVQEEYPVVLSTTFSARSSLSKEAQFDYVIIDEASQVDVATGALALSCAKNAVIVGDIKQLPNVLPAHQRLQLQKLFESSGVRESYNYANKSFLESVCDTISSVPQTLLREHYRCHPRIINFCNRKFYDGKLVIMTQDKGESDVIAVTKTVVGNHARDHVNQRQLEILVGKVLPKVVCPDDEIGIIAPYNKQVSATQAALASRGIDVATVHKFQGREKDTIVLLTVDDQVTEFSDDPNLMNVALSRAKRSLHVIASGNKQPLGSNLRDLIDYIEYVEGEVTTSEITSIFDYLYDHYAESRERLLKSRRISEFDSENLMNLLIRDVLHQQKLTSLDVLFQQPLMPLLRNREQWTSDELRYASNPATHVDFLIYHRFSKQPLLALEVDGYHYHKKGTVQARRDAMKDRLLTQYGIPFLRFQTNASGERERLVAALGELMRQKLASD